MNESRLLVTLCTYNERENLQQLIPEILRHAPSADILVVDDNSPDGTAEFVKQLQAHNTRLHLLWRPGKQGLGTATRAAFLWGLERDYDLLCNLDADFSHPPEVIPRLVAACADVDVAVGSRYIPGGDVVGWSWKRHVMSRLINGYARLLLGLRTHDNSGSFRCYRVDVLRRVPWNECLSKGYAIQEEILYRLRRAGARFVEVPFTFAERRYGQTKISWREAFSAGWDLFRLRWRLSAGEGRGHGDRVG